MSMRVFVPPGSALFRLVQQLPACFFMSRITVHLLQRMAGVTIFQAISFGKRRQDLAFAVVAAAAAAAVSVV